jgi:hypothetical protein
MVWTYDKLGTLDFVNAFGRICCKYQSLTCIAKQLSANGSPMSHAAARYVVLGKSSENLCNRSRTITLDGYQASHKRNIGLPGGRLQTPVDVNILRAVKRPLRSCDTVRVTVRVEASECVLFVRELVEIIRPRRSVMRARINSPRRLTE